MKKADVAWLALAIAMGGIAYTFRENIAPLEVYRLSVPNPTSYEFRVPADVARNAIVYGFSDSRSVVSSFYATLPLRTSAPGGGNVSYTAETNKNAVFGKDVFMRPGDNTDVFLHSFGESILSSTYCALGTRLPYRADFSIIVQSAGDNSLVTVKALNPRVLKGIGGFGPHGAYPAEVSVEPTSIEEYSVLLYIGHLLHAPSMSPVLTPRQPCAPS